MLRIKDIWGHLQRLKEAFRDLASKSMGIKKDHAKKRSKSLANLIPLNYNLGHLMPLPAYEITGVDEIYPNLKFVFELSPFQKKENLKR